jgi:hypothetical protein
MASVRGHLRIYRHLDWLSAPQGETPSVAAPVEPDAVAVGERVRRGSKFVPKCLITVLREDVKHLDKSKHLDRSRDINRSRVR